MKTIPGFTADASLAEAKGVYRAHGRGLSLTGAAVLPAAGACTAEGFFPNEGDCTRFYRCVDSDGSFTKFDFQCGPNTMYHPDLMTCVHPWQMPPGKCNPGG